MRARAGGIRNTMAQDAARDMQTPIRILLVEDTPVDAELASRALTKAGLDHTMERVASGRDFLERLASFAPDVILSDYSMPGFDGADALALARRHAPEIPFIFLSGTIGEENAIESLRNGAVDYILKNNMGRLPTAVERALRDSEERKVKQRAERELQQVQERFALFMQHLPGPAFIKDLEGRLQFALQARLTHDGARLQSLARALQAVSPLSTLERGFAVVTRSTDGALVTDARQLAAGERFDARLAHGTLHAAVVERRS